MTSTFFYIVTSCLYSENVSKVISRVILQFAGIYADSEKLKDLLKSKIGKAPAKPTEEMYQLVIDSDVGLVVRLVMVYPGLNMSMFKKNRDDHLVASIKKLDGDNKNKELADK